MQHGRSIIALSVALFTSLRRRPWDTVLSLHHVVAPSPLSARVSETLPSLSALGVDKDSGCAGKDVAIVNGRDRYSPRSTVTDSGLARNWINTPGPDARPLLAGIEQVAPTVRTRDKIIQRRPTGCLLGHEPGILPEMLLPMVGARARSLPCGSGDSPPPLWFFFWGRFSRSGTLPEERDYGSRGLVASPGHPGNRPGHDRKRI
ncbi:hypothetical protein N7462_011716 [Penicillium macrosclerotiorum]|uniref:uncharacterized protein n=1 Tax=Penicillium macrosclerotiorum TaxID=303699 RepID=UPI0025481D88|nr:uncharacterized protein N7462_011716 [Penicillium macrosclerotiorum]KAJ5662790.1 hypothetical protein N7462_011716 [Penicillium macrosclerotiorum]